MAGLQDCEMERLSDLLAKGDMDNAPEIAKLLEEEFGERPDDLEEVSLQPYWQLFDLLTSRPRSI